LTLFGRRRLPPFRSCFFKQRSMEVEALLPAATASTTDAGPETTSPPAKTPGHVVSSVTGSTWMVPPAVVFSFSGIEAGSTVWPTARMTASAPIVFVRRSS